ncbi:MAG: DUF1273 family protein [Clostridia bacterium]|nr:DUF1273 family protein [Clostridia bacterium]
MKNTTCCFIGHRHTNETEELKERVRAVVERLINDEKVDTFLFGSKSGFDSLCLELVTELKREKYPHLKRVYVRAMYPYVNDHYLASLLSIYDETYFPDKLLGAGRAAYVERNFEMIDNSRFCVIYYDEAIAPTTRKSGTRVALDYAQKKKREIIKP